MKRRLDMDRMFVDDAPKPVYTATEPCIITLWCLPNLEVEQDERGQLGHVAAGVRARAKEIVQRFLAVLGHDQLVGDVAFAAVQTVAGRLTPNPGGVGPMTIAMLMLNTVRAAEMVAG